MHQHGRQQTPSRLDGPDGIAARQHFDRLKKQLQNSNVLCELLVGSLSQREQNELLQRIAIGTVDIVVGTQALLSEHVRFHSLGLVVIDEQHKFGVEQRAILRESRTVPHYLVLSATPIPRSIAMTQFGDLDISVLREKPPGRAPVHTYLGSDQNRNKWWDFVRKQLSSGRQAYVVIPRVDADAQNELHGVEEFALELNGELRDFRVEVLHGRMDGGTKQQKLDAFEMGSIQVLVATTVVEVGIDVPNATLMDDFGRGPFGVSSIASTARTRVEREPPRLCLPVPDQRNRSL